jgi:hypothetical protein
LQEAKRRTTSSEFVLWQVLFEEEWHHHTKQDYYLAQIACEIRRIGKKHPERIKLKTFLLEFERLDEKKPEEELTQEEYTARSKAAWLGGLGVLDKKPKKSRPYPRKPKQ